LKRGQLSDTTVRNYFRDLSGFAAWLVQTGHLPYNPLDGITPPAATKVSIYTKAIPRADIDIMIDQAETIRDRAIFIFFRDTACRGSEVAAMRWENVDLDEGKAYVVGKGGKLRTLRFKHPTAQVLEGISGNTPSLPPDRAGLVGQTRSLNLQWHLPGLPSHP
jgi:site-specific recombinase XerC